MKISNNIFSHFFDGLFVGVCDPLTARSAPKARPITPRAPYLRQLRTVLDRLSLRRFSPIHRRSQCSQGACVCVGGGSGLLLLRGELLLGRLHVGGALRD